MPQSQVLSFFIELFHRLRTKSPKVFRVLQVFAGSLTFAGYVPSMLQRWFGVEVPGYTITMCEDISKYAAGFFVAALLPVKTPPIAQTKEGEPVQVTDEKKLPFTAKAEEKAIKEAVPPVPVVNVPDAKSSL